ncbi:hypothetical protein [Clostridium butyricum]|uniref:hypothetical protein n=1 Tax=Clostridium butyricum TaxID=1492 RepID=UPI0022E7421B|nr:hypothetical protein [Clostridium butyricum]
MRESLEKKSTMRKLTYDNYITGAFLVLLGITLAFNIFFQDGNKLFRIILTAVAVIIMKVVFTISFLKKSKASYTATLTFIFFAMYLGNVCNFYTLINHYDKILHLLSGIIIGIIGLIIYTHFTKEYMKKLNPKFMIIFVFIFSVALAGCWEIWEFTGDRLWGFQSQNNSLVDTMTDIICGTVGGIISLFPIYGFAKGKKNRFLEKVTKEVI